MKIGACLILAVFLTIISFSGCASSKSPNPKKDFDGIFYMTHTRITDIKDSANNPGYGCDMTVFTATNEVFTVSQSKLGKASYTSCHKSDINQIILVVVYFGEVVGIDWTQGLSKPPSIP